MSFKCIAITTRNDFIVVSNLLESSVTDSQLAKWVEPQLHCDIDMSFNVCHSFFFCPLHKVLVYDYKREFMCTILFFFKQTKNKI